MVVAFAEADLYNPNGTVLAIVSSTGLVIPGSTTEGQ